MLPAFFAFVFKNNADEYALWGYRLLNCLTLGGCSVLLFQVAQLFSLRRAFAFLLVALFSCHVLIVDNSINGMEAPYMMLFLILLVRKLYAKEPVRAKDFILPFTGLMYTRPDGFVYAGFLILGFLIFHFDKKDIRLQLPLIKKLLLAALISTLLFLPWILFAWYYYENPIPNTILAKSVFKDWNAWTFIKEFIKFPLSIFQASTNYVLSGLFMPGYAGFGGWYGLEIVGRIISTCAFFGFLFPFFPKAARAFSLSVYLVVFYLTVVSGQGGQPWYLPNLSLQVMFFFCIVLNGLYEKYHTKAWTYLGYSVLGYNFIILLFGAYYFKTQQELIEYGNRKKIGIWLHAQAESEQETVFLECLGYIGYFSQLKMYDFPGMSSPEVVEVLKEGKKTNNVCYSRVVDRLRPDWLVLRPWEAEAVRKEMPGLLENYYRHEKTFSVKDRIPEDWFLMGKPYLEHDAVFLIFKKKVLPKQINHSPEVGLLSEL